MTRIKLFLTSKCKSSNRAQHNIIEGLIRVELSLANHLTEKGQEKEETNDDKAVTWILMGSETDSTTEDKTGEDMIIIKLKETVKDIEHNDIIIEMTGMSRLQIEGDMIEMKGKEIMDTETIMGKIETQGMVIMMETDSTE